MSSLLLERGYHAGLVNTFSTLESVLRDSYPVDAFRQPNPHLVELANNLIRILNRFAGPEAGFNGRLVHPADVELIRRRISIFYHAISTAFGQIRSNPVLTLATYISNIMQQPYNGNVHAADAAEDLLVCAVIYIESALRQLCQDLLSYELLAATLVRVTRDNDISVIWWRLDQILQLRPERRF